MAINRIGDALASGGTTFTSDDDIELVGDALPFSLKMVESLLAEVPRHRGLLLTACQGFTSYAYVYVHNRADVVAVDDIDEANQMRARARRLYMRGHGYCMDALENAYPGITERLLTDPEQAVAGVRKSVDVPLLYWSAASLGLAISASRKDATMLARLPEVEACVKRGLELDEHWDDGSLHAFEVTLAGATPGAPDLRRIEKHYERALEMSQGSRAALYVAYAESVDIPQQNRAGFQAALQKALAIDPDAHKDIRLMNLVAQRRAKWLLERVDELILSDQPPQEEEVSR